MTKEELYQEIKKLPNEMPSDKRLAAYFKGEIVDHQPCMMNAGQGVYAKMVGLANENVNDLEVQCEIIRRKELLYGMRGTRASMNLRTVGEALGSVVYYPKQSTEYITDHFMKRYSQLSDMENLDVKNNAILKGIVEKGKLLKKRFPDMKIGTGCPGPMSAAASVRGFVIARCKKESRKSS